MSGDNQLSLTKYLAWGSISILASSQTTVSAAAVKQEIPKHEIIKATKERHDQYQLLKNTIGGDTSIRHLQDLSTTQFTECQGDLLLADTDNSSTLTKSEFLNFLSLNSNRYGHTWGYAGQQTTLSELPLEFPMLFHSTACMCAYDMIPMDFGCCEGDNGVIQIHATLDETSGEMKFDEEDDAYTRLFCTEAFYSYDATFVPTEKPTPMPTGVEIETGKPTPFEDGTSTSSTTTTVETTTEATTTSTTQLTTTTTMDRGMTVSPTASPVHSVTSTSATPGSTTAETTTGSTTTTPATTTSSGEEEPKCQFCINGFAVANDTPTAAGQTCESTKAIAVNFSPDNPTCIQIQLAESICCPVPINPGTTSSTTPSTPGTSTTVASTTTTDMMVETSSPTPGPTRNVEGAIIEIPYEYGITSNCGLTAFDILEGSYGVTIKDGLIVATEQVVVSSLNATYPRDGSEPIIPVESIQSAPPAPLFASASQDGTRFALPILGDAAPVSTHSKGVPSSDMHGVRMRIEGLPHTPSKGGLRQRDLAVLSNTKQHDQKAHLSSMQVNQLAAHNKERALAYFTPANPVIITDVEDVLDDPSCPFGINCMRVLSKIFLTLESGDNPGEVESVIRNGLQNSFADNSFFNGLPYDTVFCPPVETDPPVPAPVPAPVPTPFPTPEQTVRGSTIVPTTPGVLESPAPTPSLTWPPTSSSWPTPETWSPTITPWPGLTPQPSAVSGGTPSDVTPLEVVVTFDIENDCGYDAEAVMTGEGGNTLVYGLEGATESVVIMALNETFPRVEDGTRNIRARRNVRARRTSQRELAKLVVAASSSSQNHQQQQQQHRSLVYYTKDDPVQIQRIRDIEEKCPAGQNCLLVVVSIKVMLEEGDNPAEVNTAINEAMKQSFEGSQPFFGYIPQDTVIC